MIITYAVLAVIAMALLIGYAIFVRKKERKNRGFFFCTSVLPL